MNGINSIGWRYRDDENEAFPCPCPLTCQFPRCPCQFGDEQRDEPRETGDAWSGGFAENH